jgi:23S rRNA (adenine2503-C2)-methyltransferase
LRSFTDLTRDEAEAEAERLGFRSLHGREAFAWVQGRGAETYEAMTSLPQGLRARLAAERPLFATRLAGERVSADGTRKSLLATEGGTLVESVLIPETRRTTICLSTQVGCAVACRFCASGRAGLRRSLETGEIVEQVLHRRRSLPQGRRITHVVFMGIGEPLHNLERVTRAIRILHDPLGAGLGARRITVSTVGVPARIEELSHVRIPVNLAISLHAATPSLRAALIPTQAKVAPRALVDAAKAYRKATGRDVTFEWALLRGVNDGPTEVRALGRLLRGVPATVNVIPYNPVDGAGFERPDATRVREFVRRLQGEGVRATIRATRGDVEDAACGQLRVRIEGTEAPLEAGPAELDR